MVGLRNNCVQENVILVRPAHNNNDVRCDSWRKKYRSQYPGWQYKLWTDKEVAKMNLRTREYYDNEKMFQCKADLLRLEILWNEVFPRTSSTLYAEHFAFFLFILNIINMSE